MSNQNDKGLTARLLSIQQELKAPKNQYNSFGKYKYRKLEDVLDAVKPLLAREGLTLTLTDTVLEAGPFVYVDAVASITAGENSISVAAQAGIEKAGGMQLSQAFGAASSYARKYALNGLFLIDDTKDADGQEPTKPTAKKTATPNGKAKPKKKVVGPLNKLNIPEFVHTGWDEKTIRTGKDGTPFIETDKEYIKLNAVQHLELITHIKEMVS